MEEDILLNFGIKKVRGRQDSVTLTLPPAWVRDHGLAPVGKCMVQVHMDSQKRLVLTPLDIIDDAVPVKRQKKSENQSDQYYSEDNQEEDNNYPDTSYIT